MSEAKVELVEYKKDRQDKTETWVYELSHSDKKTILKQDLTVTRDRFGQLTLNIDTTDFPNFFDKKESVAKMANWLQRLSWAIQSGIKNGAFDG